MSFTHDRARAALRAARNALKNLRLQFREEKAGPEVLTKQERRMLRLLSKAVVIDPESRPFLHPILEVRRSSGSEWEVAAPPVERLTRKGLLLGSRSPVVLNCASQDLAIAAARLLLRVREGGEVHVLNDADEVAKRIWILNYGTTKPPLIGESR